MRPGPAAAAGNLPAAFGRAPRKLAEAARPRRPGRVLTMPGAPLPFHVMAKPTGGHPPS
jgi:hypothetical protein